MDSDNIMRTGMLRKRVFLLLAKDFPDDFAQNKED